MLPWLRIVVANADIRCGTQVKWLHSVKKGCHPEALRSACINGHLHVARWLKANCTACQEWTLQQPDQLASFTSDPLSIQSSNVGAHLVILKWLLSEYEMGASLYRLVADAVLAGNEECFQFLMNQPEKHHLAAKCSRFRIHPCLMQIAAEHGRTAMLSALSQITGAAPLWILLYIYCHIDLNCYCEPWSQQYLKSAVRSEVAILALWSSGDSLQKIPRCKSITKHLEQSNFPACSTHRYQNHAIAIPILHYILARCVVKSSLPMWQCFADRPWFTGYMPVEQLAVANNHLSVLEWLCKNGELGGPSTTDANIRALITAILKNNLPMVKYLMRALGYPGLNEISDRNKCTR